MNEVKSPQRLYDELLLKIKENLAEREMNDFEFALRNDLPTTVLEVRHPLKWFSELEKRCLLSPDDLSRLENALELAHLNFLLEDVRRVQVKRRVVVFFQKHVEEMIAGLRLDEKFKQSYILRKQLVPRGFQKKCQELTLEESGTTCTIQDLQSLMSNGVEILVNSCSSHRDLDSVAMKVLYLSDIVFQKFERIIVDMDMLKDYLSGSLPLSSTIHDGERLPAENGPVIRTGTSPFGDCIQHMRSSTSKPVLIALVKRYNFAVQHNRTLLAGNSMTARPNCDGVLTCNHRHF